MTDDPLAMSEEERFGRSRRSWRPASCGCNESRFRQNREKSLKAANIDLSLLVTEASLSTRVNGSESPRSGETQMDIAKQLAALNRMNVAELVTRYGEVFNEQPPRTQNKAWLIKRVAWRIQALAEGDLSERARRRAAELANDADLRVLAPRENPS